MAGDGPLPRLVIRADATFEIGGGHVMRCLALAQAWQAQCGAVEFVGKYDGAFAEGLARAGVAVTHVPRVHPDKSDLAVTKERIAASPRGMRPFVVIDGYHFDVRYQQSIREERVRVVVLHDGDAELECEADVVLNQNLHAEQIPYDYPPNVVVLAGTKYALIRSEFRRMLPEERQVRPIARRVLATMGGSDPRGASAVVLDAFEQLSELDLRLDLVVGPGNLHERELATAATKLGGRVRLVRNPPDMGSLMREADLAVAAAGSTAWELAAAGVPSLLTAVAPNQTPIARALDKCGAAIDLGSIDALTPEALSEAIRNLAADPTRRSRLAARAREFVDGSGADRLVTVLRAISSEGPLEWSSRFAASADSMQLWRIANDPIVRAHSFSRDPIPPATHQRWLSAQLSAKNTRLWVADLAGVVVGQARYAVVDRDSAEVHFSVAAPFRGRRVAGGLLERTFTSACTALDVGRIRGVAFARNAASARAFEAAGYACVESIERGGEPCQVFERWVE